MKLFTMIKLASVLLFGLLALTACKPNIMVNEMCIFNESDLIAPNASPEAEHAFQMARSFDISIISDMPETIPPELRGKESDRVVAKKHYLQAAEMGHTGAMNNLAFYLSEGYGNPDHRNGRPDFTEDHKGGFYWNQEMARRGDAKGYVGMSGYFYSDRIGLPDPARGEACLVEAAKMDHMRGIILLARQDLGMWDGSGIETLNPVKVERGITLLEDAGLQSEAEALKILGDYYNYYHKDWPKYEYYIRESIKMGSRAAQRSLAAKYREGTMGQIDLEHSECLYALKSPERHSGIPNSHDLETLCPRPDGPLSREEVGLPPAPTTRLDLRAYLTDFQQSHPNP